LPPVIGWGAQKILLAIQSILEDIQAMKSAANSLIAFGIMLTVSLSIPIFAQAQTFGDWAKQCESVGQGERCFMIQTVKAGDRPIMVVVVAYSTKRDQVAAMIDVPLGMHIPTGLKINAAGAAKPLAFEQCLPTGCRAILALDEATIEMLKAGGDASITGRGRDGENVQMPISSNGFKDAFETL
jgi:invasion protein IalB